MKLLISERSKLAQKEYKTGHDWEVKVIHWEMYKKFRFDLTNKWYLYNPAAALENDTHKLWDIHGSPDHGQKTKPNNQQKKKGEFAELSTLLSRLTTD